MANAGQNCKLKPRGFATVERASGWERVERIPPLAAGDLQLWRLDARGEPGRLLADACRGLLSAEELARSEAIRVEVARREFAAGRALLRRLLGAALECDPKDVAFSFDENGKPQVTPAAGVEFNLSHSSGMVLAGIARGVALGVDVEWIDPAFAKGKELLAIADEHFDPAQRMSIRRTVSESERSRSFYAAWTRKEAISKVFGLGIASKTRLAEAEADRRLAAKAAAGGSDWTEENGCFVRSLEVATGFAASVAVAGEPRQMRLYDASDLLRRSPAHEVR